MSTKSIPCSKGTISLVYSPATKIVNTLTVTTKQYKYMWTLSVYKKSNTNRCELSPFTKQSNTNTCELSPFTKQRILLPT